MDAAQAGAPLRSDRPPETRSSVDRARGPGTTFSARVVPIRTGETRKITLKYTQLLDRAGRLSGGSATWANRQSPRLTRAVFVWKGRR